MIKIPNFLDERIGCSEIGDWNAHLFFFNRAKNLIFVNNKSFYCVIIENVKKSDLKNLDNLFLTHLIDQLTVDNVIERNQAQIIIQKHQPIMFCPTNNNKRVIGTMNHYIFNYEVYRNHPVWFDTNVRKLNSLINDSITRAGRNEKRKYGRPSEEMKLLIYSLI
ncbi:MAG: hypothetical protein O9297_11950 [Flavobacterium sp.]|nr:hypothetical protein [Flavobacterium sp.]MCZ8297917.1 hypothetical protein [Flavobacterium sp.]